MIQILAAKPSKQTRIAISTIFVYFRQNGVKYYATSIQRPYLESPPQGGRF